MQVKVYLHGILRDYLPSEVKGWATVSLQEGATVGDLLAKLGIERRVVVALNDEHEPDKSYVLQDGDEAGVYMVTGGGQGLN